MSEFRKGRKRFISRDPSKANNSQWKEGYNGSVIAKGTNVAATSKNDANYIHQPTFDLQATDLVTYSQYTGSTNRIPSLKQRSTRPTSPNSGLRSEYYSSRPSDNRQNNDVSRSRDRSALRVITIDNKTRIGTERRMASEMGFRPILRRHGSSSSSCESLSLKDNGILAMESSKTTLCPVTLPDSHPAPTTTIPAITASQKTESGVQQGQTLPGTFLTLPANADSMQVQIRDTKISITRMSDQIQDATPRVRTLSAEYDNVPDPTPSPSAKDTSVPQSVPPAFAPSYESPGQLSPVRGLRLVPSPNSAFTKTTASKASSQIQSEYANWTVPALSLGPGRGPLELERSVKPSPRGQLNSIIPEQNPIDFNLIFSGIGLRPYDLEDFVPEKRKTFRALKSCSLESIPVVEGETGKTPGRTNRASANNPSEFDPQPLLGKTGTNKIDAPPNSKATGQSSVSISQTTSCDNQSNVKRLLTEVEIRPQRNYRVQSATITKPITDALAVIGKHPPTAQQPIRNSVVNDSSSLTLKALTDPFTNLSKTDLQPIADGPTNVFTSTVIQPITSSKQSYWATSVGSVTSASNVSHPVKSKNCLVEPCQSSAGPASRPITISTTSFGKVNVSTYILPPSSSSIMSTATPYSPPGTVESVTMAEPTMASAMSSLEKAISMLKSVAMDTSAPGAPMSILSTIATDTESLAKSFQLEARTVGTEFSYHQDKPLDGREVVLPPYELTIDGNQNTLKTGPTPEVAAPLPGDFEYSVREDAVLNLTLNLLDQTLAEIHQEFPPGRRPSAGKTPKAEVSSSATTLTSGPALHRLPEMTSYLKAKWDSSVSCHAPDQPKNSSTFPEAQHWNAPGSRVSAETTESDRCLRRILDRQDSFNRPGSSLFPETLPLPKDSVIQRYRRKKKTKSSASSSSSSSSSTSSSSREDGDGNGAAGAKRSPRSGRRHTRRHRRSEDGAAAAAGENKTKTRTCHRRRRAEEHSDKEQGRQTYKHADIQEFKSLTYSLSNNLNLVASVESVTIEQSPVAETWQTLAAGPAQDHLQVFDSVYLSAKPSQETPDQSASINELSDLLLGSGVQQGVTPSMTSTMYANSVSDSERTGISVVHRRFRNLGKSVEDDGDMASRLSPQGIPRPTSASSPRNQSTPIARSHSSGSCSPADTSTRTKNLTPFSHRRRRLGENRSPAANEEQVVNEHHQHQSHHMSFSSDRLSAMSADEEVFLARVRQSVSPPQKLHDESSQSGIGPLRVRIRSKESISSGAHGCDHRTNSESPLSHREKVHSDSDRGPRESSLTGSVRLTLKQKSEDLTDESGPQKIRTLSTRTNSSTDEFPGIIRAHSKAISYESICLKIKEESTEIPKTIQVISMSQPSNLISTTKAVLLEQEETNCSPPGSIHGTPCSASQLYDVQSVEAISVRPVQRDHSIKHRSTVFFSSEQPSSGSHNNLLTQMKSASVFPVQTSKVSSFPAKISQQDVLESKRKSEHALPANISEQQNQSRSGEVVTQNKECRDDTLHTSTQKFAKSDAPQKLTIIGAPKHGAKPDKRSSKVGSTVQASNEIPNRSIVKESKFFLKRDQQLPMNNSQLIMGTVFTDRNNPRQNLLFPGTDFIQRDNSGRTSESKTSQGSKSVQQVSSYKIIKHNSRPVVEESQISVVVPENKGDPLVNKTKLSADGSAQIAALFSKDSGNRIKILQPVTTTQDNKKFASSFLCSLSKFSQPPAESVFMSTSRPKPLSVSSSTSSFSRVDWAKQRLGQAPENKPSTTAISQLKTSLKDLSSSGTTHQPGSDHQQMHNTGAASTTTLEQDRTNCIDGKHTITVARQQFPSVGESSQTTAPHTLPVTVQDVSVSPSPVVLGAAKSTTSSALLAFTKPPEASVPSEIQNSASTGNFATGSLKVFIQSANPTAVLKRTSLLVPYLNAPLSDVTSLQSTDTAKLKDTRTPELEVQCYGDMESTGSFRKPYADSTCLVTTVLPSSLSEDVTVTAFVCDPPVSDVCVLVQETGATMIVEPILPEDNQIVVMPIDSIAYKEQPPVDSSNSNVINKVTHAEASPKNSFQAASNNYAVGEAIDFGQVAQDPLGVICPGDEEAFGGKTLELEISSSDFLDGRFESDSLRKGDWKSADNRAKGEVSPNENSQQQLLPDSLSADTYAQVPGPGVCFKEAQLDAAGDIYVVDSGWNLSQFDGNPESPCPSSASEESNESMVIIDQPETTSESITKICRLQGPNNSQREFIRDLVQPDSEIEISAGRNLATTKENRRGSDGVNESLTVSTRDTTFESVQSDGKRAERTDQTVKPEAEVVRGPLTKTPSIPSLEIIVGKSEATSSSATTSTSSAKSTSSTKIATAAIASAKKSQNTDTVSKEGPLSHADKGGNLVQNFAVDILQKDFVEECRVGSGQSILPETTKTNPSLVCLTKTTAEKEKTRRVVRFESQDEMLMYSPKEFSASGPGFSPPSDVPTEIPCLPINATEADALGPSATISGPAVIRSPDASFLGDFPSKPSRKDPETSREDSSKASPPSTGKTMAKPCIVRKQLIHLDSALHPSSCVPPEAKPVEARWSPKLVRKLNLAEAKDVDVSDLDVAPDLMDFLSKQMEKASGDVKQPASNREAKDELEIGIREIPSLSVQRKPPLSLPLKSADREEDALPSTTSATDNDAVKPEAEVGKRKFFSALKANASSFRAKKVPAVDDPSPDKSHLDRLASFALISDVGIGAKRRQFQQHKETSLTDPTTDAHSRLLTLESPPSTDRNQTKKASFLVLSSPDADDDNTKTRLGRDDESETRLGAESEKRTRLSRPEIDSDDDFDRLVEINFRQLVDEKGSAAGALRDVSGSTELLRKGAKNQTGTGLGGTSGTAGVEGSRRQMSRFKTQPVTPVEVEKAREMALYQSNSGN